MDFIICFDTHGSQARTLLKGYFTDEQYPTRSVYTKEHDNGWKLTALIHEDYFYWVNEFSAVHPTLGEVSGDFESVVNSTSKKAYEDFVKNFPYETWDYGDI